MLFNSNGIQLNWCPCEVEKAVFCASDSCIDICWNPDIWSNTLKYFALLSWLNISIILGRGYRKVSYRFFVECVKIYHFIIIIYHSSSFIVLLIWFFGNNIHRWIIWWFCGFDCVVRHQIINLFTNFILVERRKSVLFSIYGFILGYDNFICNYNLSYRLNGLYGNRNNRYIYRYI